MVFLLCPKELLHFSALQFNTFLIHLNFHLMRSRCNHSFLLLHRYLAQQRIQLCDFSFFLYDCCLLLPIHRFLVSRIFSFLFEFRFCHQMNLLIRPPLQSNLLLKSILSYVICPLQPFVFKYHQVNLLRLD